MIILKWTYHYDTQARRYVGSYNGVNQSELEAYFKVVIDTALGSCNVATDCRYSGLEGAEEKSLQINRDIRNFGRDSNSVPPAYNSTPTLQPCYYSVRFSVTKWLPNFYLVPHLNTMLSHGATNVSLSIPTLINVSHLYCLCINKQRSHVIY